MPTPDPSNPAEMNFVERSRRLIHKGRKFDFEHVSVARPDGRVVERDIVRHPGAVVILPVLPDGRLVMIRVYRIAVGRAMLEFPAGTLEPGEDPADCAARELIEETGYRAATLAPLGWFHTTPGLTDEMMHAFVASGLQHVGQALEEDEDIQVLTMPAEEALAMVDRGELQDGKSIVLLLSARRRGLLNGGHP